MSEYCDFKIILYTCKCNLAMEPNFMRLNRFPTFKENNVNKFLISALECHL